MAKQPAKKVETKVTSFDQTQKNRDRKLAKHLKLHPKDEQAAKAKGTAAPVRKAAKAKGNFPEQKFYARDGAGHKELVTLTYGQAELFHRGSMKPRDYEDQVRKARAPTFEVLKATQGKFGSLKPTEEAIMGNVKALCFGLGIKSTGRKGRK